MSRLRNGTSTIHDWKVLLTRVATPENLKKFKDCVSIFNDNESVDKLNLEKLKEKKMPITKLIAVNTSKKGLVTSSQQFGGLVNSIYISNNCNVSLTNNVWQKTGKITFK